MIFHEVLTLPSHFVVSGNEMLGFVEEAHMLQLVNSDQKACNLQQILGLYFLVRDCKKFLT